MQAFRPLLLSLGRVALGPIGSPHGALELYQIQARPAFACGFAAAEKFGCRRPPPRGSLAPSTRRRANNMDPDEDVFAPDLEPIQTDPGLSNFPRPFAECLIKPRDRISGFTRVKVVRAGAPLEINFVRLACIVFLFSRRRACLRNSSVTESCNFLSDLPAIDAHSRSSGRGVAGPVEGAGCLRNELNVGAK